MKNKKENEKVQLSFIIPALNEEENILKTLEEALEVLEEFGICGELVVVNDGSSDGTEKIVRGETKKFSNVKLVNHERNMGIGASFWDGVDVAQGEVVVFLPGDNENDPREILRFFDLMEQVDIVIPFIVNKEVRSFFRKTISSLYTFLINLTFFTNFNYTNGTSLYRRSVLKSLDYRAKGFFYQSDILVRLVKGGYLYAEVPNTLDVRVGGKSKALRFSSLMSFLKEYIYLLLCYHILRKVKLRKTFPKDTITFKKRKNNE